MIELLGGFRISQALYAAAVLGIADQLVAGPAPAEVLAAQAGAHAPSLYRLLRTPAGAGVFTEPEPDVFALTPLGHTLSSDQPGSLRDLAIMWMETPAVPFTSAGCTGRRRGAVVAEHDIGVEHGQQRAEVAVAQRGEEGIDDLPLPGEIGLPGWSSAVDPSAGAAGELAGSGRGAVQDGGDLLERHGEDAVRDEGEPLGGGEGVEHHHQRRADLVG